MKGSELNWLECISICLIDSRTIPRKSKNS